MKKWICLILTVCMALSVAAVSFAEQASEHVSVNYRLALPEGNWFYRAGNNGISYYYDNSTMQLGNGFIMILEQDMNLGTLSDAQMDQAYDILVQTLAGSAVDGQISSEPSVLCGTKARSFRYIQQVSGNNLNVFGNCVIINDHFIAICYASAGSDEATAQSYMDVMSASAEYIGK